MADNNEFGFTPTPDTPEAYQAAEANATAEAQALGQEPVVPAPTDDIDDEPAAGDAPVTPAQPAAPAAPTAPAPAVAAAPAEADRNTKILGLHEDPNSLGLEGTALETKLKLAKEPKVRMMIPLDPGERVGAYRTVVINGYRFDVKKNVMVDLPQSVASLLANSYRITSEVLEDNPLNLNNADAGKRAALGI